MYLNKKALTFVEMLIVLTIIAILSTIGFLSYLNYTSNSRDAVRSADLTNMNRILSLHKTSRLFYPSPTDATTIAYSGASLWEQGVFGTATQAEIGKIFGDLIDPKYLTQYSYSVTNNKKEYQLGAVFENQTNIPSFGLTAYVPDMFQVAYAADPFDPLELSPIIWLDGEDIDGDGDTNDNPSDGANITTWVNKSSAGSTNNPTRTGGDLQYTTTGLDGSYPGVYIDDDLGLLLNNSDITQGDIFYVVQNNDPFGSTDKKGRALQSANSNMLIGYWDKYRHSLYIDGAPSHYSSSPATKSGRSSYAFVYGFHTDGTNYAFYDAGNLISQGSTNSITGETWAFNQAGSSAQYAEFVVSEILIFDTKLSSDDRQKIEGYLAHKWGQDSWLSSSHPYKDAPPESSGPPPDPDTTPDSFIFNDVTGADISTEYISNTITVTGINTPTPISVTGGEYSVNGGSYVSTSGNVSLGDTISVRLTSSASNNTAVTTTLDIGGVTEDYIVTTLIADITPDSFSFNAVSDADISTEYISNTITVSGLNTLANISITGTGAQYKVSDGIPIDATGGGTASASSTYSANSPTEAFDNNTSANGWGNNGSLPARLIYDFGSGNDVVVTQYTLYRSSSQSGGWSNNNYSPKNWTFEGSDDNSNWTVLDTQTNEYIGSNQTKKTYSFTNPNYYRYYRINISSAYGNTNWVNITEMEMIHNGGGVFTSSGDTVQNGDIISIRMPSSSSPGTLKTAQLTIGTVTGNYDITTVAPDTTPDSFSFTDVTNASLNTQYIDNITVSGINASSPVSITGLGVFEINNSGIDLTTGNVANGDLVTIKLTSPSSSSSTYSTTMTIGGVNATFNVSTPAPPPDTTPDSFSFTDITDASLNTLYTSDTITLSGINTTTSISITGGSYDINGSNSYTTSPGSISNGDQISLRATSSSTPGQDIDVILTVGSGPSVQDTFTITTIAPDTTPDPYVLGYVTEALLNQTYESNPIIVTGINAATPIDITGGGGKYKINGGDWESGAGVVYQGDEVIVKLQSLVSGNSHVSTTLDIGGVTAVFDITTLLDDTTPDSFSFTDITNATLNTQYTSNTITITGINASASISITGGEYRVGSTGTFTSSPSTISNGEELTLRLVSAITGDTLQSAVVTIGGQGGSYNVTTQEFSVSSNTQSEVPVSDVYVSGEYNGLIAHANNGDTHYVIATPSIMTYDLDDTDIISIITNKKLVYNGFDNVPASYSGSSLIMDGGFDFNITSPLIYEGNKEDLGSYGGLKQVDEGIRSIYGNFPSYKNVAEYLDDYSLNYLEQIIGNIIGINPIKPFYCSDILQSKLIYNIAPDATITASPSAYNGYGSGGIANGVKSTVGDLDYEYHSADGNAMIEFEWPTPKRIGYVRIYNRTGCCSDRLSGATIKLYNSFGGLIYSHPLWDTTGDYVVDLDLEGIGHLHDVKKLTLESVGGNSLNLREVEIFLGGNVVDGVYKVDKDGLGGQSPYNVYCDMTTDGGGWTRIGEDYVGNGSFASQFHIDQHTFPYGAGDTSVNVIVAHSEQTPPTYLPDAFVLRHNGSSSQSYPLYFPEIPGEYFAQEIRLSAWVKGTDESIFNNSINYGSYQTETTPEVDILETTPDGWQHQMVRLPLDGLVTDFTWNIANGVSGTLYFTGVKMEVYYK